MRLPRESDGLGILQPIVDREAARGNVARLTIGMNLVRGDPPAASLRRSLDRERIEAEFDLGPLVAWWRAGVGQWTLVDAVTGTSVEGGPASPSAWLIRKLRRTPVPDACGDRPRIGWAADHPLLNTVGWATGDLHRRVRRYVADDARATLAKLSELMDVSGGWRDPAQLPDWFVDACVPEKLPRHGRTSDRGTGQDEVRERQWWTPWSLRQWLLAMSVDERTWRWIGAEAIDRRTIGVEVELADTEAPLESLEWALRCAGVIGEVPRSRPSP